MTTTIPAPTRSRSRVARAVTVATLASILMLWMTRPMTTEAQSLLETGLIDALARVPAAAGALDSPISYVDYLAVAEARPGALVPTSLAELLALEESGDPAAARWFAASMGIASGPGDLLTELLSEGPSWPTSVGFDFADIDRAIAFGAPPANGTVLLGDFDPSAIEAAYAARGYTTSAAGDRSLLCSGNGCDAGLEIDLANRDTSVPFGGRLGRQEPLAISTAEILSSADMRTVEEMLAAIQGNGPSLAGSPSFVALANAPDDDVMLIQATLLPGSLVVAVLDLAGMIGATPDEVKAILAEFEALAPLPPPSAVAIVDGATPTEQVVTLALAYPDDADAAVAAEVVAERLRSVRSIVRDAPLAELLDERGVTSVQSDVRPAGPDMDAAAIVELRAPLAGDEPTDSGRLAPSSALYRLFVDLVFTRDLLWLAPSGEATGSDD
jgi:hypothetical protein